MAESEIDDIGSHGQLYHVKPQAASALMQINHPWATGNLPIRPFHPYEPLAHNFADRYDTMASLQRPANASSGEEDEKDQLRIGNKRRGQPRTRATLRR